MTGKAKAIIKENKLAIGCIMLSILLITIVNPNSFLYKASTCSDAGIYYNVAKGMVQGKVLYSDIYDHKGPFIFFIYAIYNLVFPCKLYGAYIMDVICYVLIQVFTYKLLKIKLDKVTAMLLAAIYTILLIWMNNSFGCPEIFAVLLESVIVYWAYTEKINNKKYLAFFGLMVGMLLMTKFTLTAFPFVMFLYFVYFNIKENTDLKVVIKNLLVLVAGIMVPIIISLVYLVKNNAFYDFIEAYILVNKGYASEDLSIVINVCIGLVAVIVIAVNRKWLVRDKMIVAAIVIQFALIMASNIFVYALLPVMVVLVIAVYNAIKPGVKYTKILCAEIVFIVAVYIIVPGVVEIKVNHQSEHIVAGANDITLMNVAAYLFNEQSEAPKNKYFFTPNLGCEVNGELWDELYNMVNEKIPDNIYVCYDGYDFQINEKFIKHSGEEVHEILGKLKENYNCVKEYPDGMYKWERK